MCAQAQAAHCYWCWAACASTNAPLATWRPLHPLHLSTLTSQLHSRHTTVLNGKVCGAGPKVHLHPQGQQVLPKASQYAHQTVCAQVGLAGNQDVLQQQQQQMQSLRHLQGLHTISAQLVPASRHKFLQEQEAPVWVYWRALFSEGRGLLAALQAAGGARER